MIIYRIFNKLNNKSYIGQSTNEFNQRYKGGKWWSFSKNKILLNSVKKHGLVNFDYEIIENRVESIERLNVLEIFYANKYNSYRPNGYNIRGCGDNKFVDEDLKKHLSKFRKGTSYSPKNKESSIYKGVYWRESKKSWQVTFDNNQLQKTKYCNSELEAAETYDMVSLFLFGKDAFINFEEKREYYLMEDLESFYKMFLLKKKKRKDGYIKDDSILLEKIKPLIWELSIPDISIKLNTTVRKISWCIKKHKLESPGKNYWQKIIKNND